MLHFSRIHSSLITLYICIHIAIYSFIYLFIYSLSTYLFIVLISELVDKCKEQTLFRSLSTSGL